MAESQPVCSVSQERIFCVRVIQSVTDFQDPESKLGIAAAQKFCRGIQLALQRKRRRAADKEAHNEQPRQPFNPVESAVLIHEQHPSSPVLFPKISKSPPQSRG